MESYGIGNGQAHASVTKEKSGTLDTMHDAQAVAIEHLEPPKKIAWIVRRLTPTECERLQGYPDGWTDIGEWTDTKGKKHKPADSPRYKALGNSIALTAVVLASAEDEAVSSGRCNIGQPVRWNWRFSAGLGNYIRQRHCPVGK